MFLKHNLYTILWALVILTITLSPGTSIPVSESVKIPNLDKVVHFLVFGVFAYLLVKGLSKQDEYKFFNYYSFLLSFIISACFGIIIEFLQIIIPGRGYDPLDIMANISGIVLGLSVYYLKDK